MALFLNGFFGCTYILVSLTLLSFGCEPIDMFKRMYREDLVKSFSGFCGQSRKGLLKEVSDVDLLKSFIFYTRKLSSSRNFLHEQRSRAADGGTFWLTLRARNKQSENKKRKKEKFNENRFAGGSVKNNQFWLFFSLFSMCSNTEESPLALTFIDYLPRQRQPIIARDFLVANGDCCFGCFAFRSLLVSFQRARLAHPRNSCRRSVDWWYRREGRDEFFGFCCVSLIFFLRLKTYQNELLRAIRRELLKPCR